jgi:ribosomal protein S18 acetylase RimI-like enzyme
MVFFYEIEVDKEHRGEGTGKALISALKDICREKSIMKMWVFTDMTNGAAMQLYTSTGGIMNEHANEVKFTYHFGREQTHTEL